MPLLKKNVSDCFGNQSKLLKDKVTGLTKYQSIFVSFVILINVLFCLEGLLVKIMGLI